jgi:DNA (cytosine-5)-methyltransferase 1
MSGDPSDRFPQFGTSHGVGVGDGRPHACGAASSSTLYHSPDKAVTPLRRRITVDSNCVTVSNRKSLSNHDDLRHGAHHRSNCSQELAESDDHYDQICEKASLCVKVSSDRNERPQQNEGEDDSSADELDNDERDNLMEDFTQPKVDLQALTQMVDEADKSSTSMNEVDDFFHDFNDEELNRAAEKAEAKILHPQKKLKLDVPPKPLMNQKINHFFSKTDTSRKLVQQPCPNKPKMFYYKDRSYKAKETWTSNVDKRLEGYLFTMSNVTRNKAIKNQQEAVIGAVHIPLSNTYIGPEESLRLVEQRKEMGLKDADKARYVSVINILDQGRIPLQLLTHQHSSATSGGPPQSDLIYERGMKEKESSGFTCAYRYKLHTRTMPNFSSRRLKKPTVLDLFGGGGGMSLGFEMEEFDVLGHVENDRAACDTLEKNFPNSVVFKECIKRFLNHCKTLRLPAYYPKPGDFDHIHGSPPCQGYSDANIFGGKNDEANNALTAWFVKVVEYFLPLTASMENVMGMLKTSKGRRKFLLKAITDLLMIGYQVRLCIVFASDYGSPQKRERLILFAANAKKGIKLPDFPKQTHGDGAGLSRIVSVRDVLGDLEELQPVFDSGLVELPDGRLVWDHCLNGAPSEKDACQLVADKPAPTVRKSNGIKHYSCDERMLTIRELALLQDFPLEYKFAGDHKKIRAQIGNAVPINLARAVARSIMASYKGE